MQAITGVRRDTVSSRDLQRAFTYLAGEGLPAGYISVHALHRALVTLQQDVLNPALVLLPLCQKNAHRVPTSPPQFMIPYALLSTTCTVGLQR